MRFKNIDIKIIANLLALKVIWGASVFGATNNVLWPCYVLTFTFIVWQLLPKNRYATDIKVLLLALPIGLILDSLWQTLGLIKYSSDNAFFPVAPLWIMCLWATFALTFNHSLRWLKKNMSIAILFGLIGSPISYLMGAKIGAMQYLTNPWLMSAIFGISWAVALFILISTAKNTNLIEHIK